MAFSFSIGCIFLLCTYICIITCDDPIWEWKCEKNHCEKSRVVPDRKESAQSLAACQVLCLNHAALWPRPTGEVKVKKSLVPVNVNSIDVFPSISETPVADLVKSAGKIFKDFLVRPNRKINPGGKSLFVTFNISDLSHNRLTLQTDESYSLSVKETEDGRLNATIISKTFFGGRHGLETLGQLIIFDDIRNQLQISPEIFISDAPVYPYRGILLDTARNYICKETIKRTIDAISASKLNTFHWHITDSQSFPFVSKSRPELSKIGAYSSAHVYNPEDIADILQYALERGVRVLPEFDSPAHVGEGWQDTDFLACFNKQPWQNYCVEPPCGQFDPSKPKLYDALEEIYKDMLDQFKPDLFHMGGDEVSLKCWGSTSSIVEWMNVTYGWEPTEAGFMNLWNLFQSQALDRLDKNAKSKLPIIMWTSTLTKKNYVESFLPKDRYIIQIWTTENDQTIKDLLNAGYKLILSNYDALYLDCGYAGWVNSEQNWCSPYIGWQKIYDNSPAKIGGSQKDQFLGAEAALWTEQVDDKTVDHRLWPRAAAMAERLWAEPNEKWQEAESRILIHRERLVNRGISAEALEPMWCLQHDENCPIGGIFNN